MEGCWKDAACRMEGSWKDAERWIERFLEKGIIQIIIEDGILYEGAIIIDMIGMAWLSGKDGRKAAGGKQSGGAKR